MPWRRTAFSWRPAGSPSAYGSSPIERSRKLGGFAEKSSDLHGPSLGHVLVEAALGFLDVLTNPGPELGPGLPGAPWLKITCSCPPQAPDPRTYRAAPLERFQGGFVPMVLACAV